MAPFFRTGRWMVTPCAHRSFVACRTRQETQLEEGNWKTSVEGPIRLTVCFVPTNPCLPISRDQKKQQTIGDFGGIFGEVLGDFWWFEKKKVGEKVWYFLVFLWHRCCCQLTPDKGPPNFVVWFATMRFAGRSGKTRFHVRAKKRLWTVAWWNNTTNAIATGQSGVLCDAELGANNRWRWRSSCQNQAPRWLPHDLSQGELVWIT